MRRFLCILFVATFFYGCFPEKVRIRSNKRISITGKVLNGNEPVANLPLATYGVFGNYVSDHHSQKLGSGKTSASGNFNFVSLDTRNGDLAISINPTFDENYLENYATLHFVDLEEDRRTLINLNEVLLPQKVSFILSLENTSGTQEDLNYSLTYKNQETVYSLEGRSGSEEEELYQWRNYRSETGRHDPSAEIKELVLLTVEDSEIIFNYALGEDELQEIIISVTPQENNYVFEY